MRWILPLLLVGLFLGAGCRSDTKPAGRMPDEKIGDDKDKDKDRDKDKDKDKGGVRGREENVVFKAGLENAPPDPNQVEKKGKEKARKIRYTADLRMIVEEFDKASDGLKAAIKETESLREQEEISTAPGEPRTGTWRIRVPVEQLDAFRDAVIKLGEVERNTLQSEDMTAQYHDLDAHVKNRNAERDALRDLLKEVGKKDIKHYIEIKRELDAITDDINRKEGQLRLWKNLTDLTTCTVYLREKQKYNAPKKVEDKEIPTFGMRAGSTWESSWETLVSVGQGSVLVAIALTPWLPIPIMLFGGWLVVRRMKRA